MFSSEDVAQSIEEFARNKSYARFKNHLPRMKKQDVDAAFYYTLNHSETEMLNILVHNASLSKDQQNKVLMHFANISDGEKITDLLNACPELDATDAMLLAGKTSNFPSIKALLPYASSHSIDRVFEYCMENHDFGIVKFLMPHISADGDHVNSLIYASDAEHQDVFELLYTIARAQQAFENIKLLSEDTWGEGYNIKPIKERLEMDLQNQRIHAQIGSSEKPTATRKI